METELSLAIPESTFEVDDAFNMDPRVCLLRGSDFGSCDERSIAWLRFVGKGTPDWLRRSSDACLAKAACDIWRERPRRWYILRSGNLVGGSCGRRVSMRFRERSKLNGRGYVYIKRDHPASRQHSKEKQDDVDKKPQPRFLPRLI